MLGGGHARRRAVSVLVWLTAAGLAIPATGSAETYRPLQGRSYFGISDTGDALHYQEFSRDVGAHPAVLQTFHTWGFHPWRALERWAETDTRGMLSVSTTDSYAGTEVISPKQIARGRGDEYPLLLNRRFGNEGETVYIRLLPEMNGHWNPYSAFNADGSARDGDHSTYWFRQAWRRFAVIVRGGHRARINRRLDSLGLPPIERADSAARYRELDVPLVLPRARASLLWVPQSSGSPNLSTNGPEDYWPGAKYVDWVGADIYAKFPNFDGLTRLYRAFRHKPFVIGEWSPWDVDDPAFVRRLFGWARRHHRTRMLVYYNGFGESDPHRIGNYPAAQDRLRHELDRPLFDAFAPGATRPARDPEEPAPEEPAPEDPVG